MSLSIGLLRLKKVKSLMMKTINTLSDEPKTKLDSFENSSNFDENFVGDLSVVSSNLGNVLSMEIRIELLLQIKHICLMNSEVLRANYNDIFLQLIFTPEIQDILSTIFLHLPWNLGMAHWTKKKIQTIKDFVDFKSGAAKTWRFIFNLYLCPRSD